MKAKTPRKTRQPKTTSLGDPNYFDVDLSERESRDLLHKILDVTGLEMVSYMAMSMEAEREICRTLGIAQTEFGWVKIHLARQLGIDYHALLKGTPKRSVTEFIIAARRAFPEFRTPDNTAKRFLLRERLHTFWIDWVDQECRRLGCPHSDHWACRDDFEKWDSDAVIAHVVEYNQTRPKLRVVTPEPQGASR